MPSNPLFIDLSGVRGSVWDDLLINSGLFQFAGSNDPVWRDWQPGGSGTSFRLLHFNLNDEIYFSCQLPHTYKEGTDLHVHVHWTPAKRGNEESGSYVGWKLDYTWTNINGSAFAPSAVIDMSDTCSGTDDYHEVSEGLTVLSGTGKTISSMLVCRLFRSDTGTDDTWTGTNADAPALLQFDIHHEIDAGGSRQEWVK